MSPRTRRAAYGVGAGTLLTASGVGWELGAGWALVVIGVVVVAVFLLGYDVDGGQR